MVSVNITPPEKPTKDIPQVLNVFLPGKCNLQCRYCFVHKQSANFNDLDEKAVKQSVNLFLAYPGRRKMLSFNGGEPLLEWDFVKKICTYAKKQAKQKKLLLGVIIVTNGTLLKQKHWDYFKQHDISVRVSLDGSKEVHDKARPFKNKKDKSSFEIIMRNLEIAKRHSLKISASLVFGPRTVDNLLENIQFLQTKNFEYLDFYPEIYATWTASELEKLAQEINKIEKYYVMLFERQGVKPFKTSMLASLLTGSEVGNQQICGKLQIDALGNFFACDKVFSLPQKTRAQYLIGSASSGIDNQKRQQFLATMRKEFLQKNKLSCETCQFQRFCFCPVGQQLYGQQNKTIDQAYWQSFCAVSKILLTLNLQIFKKLKNKEGFLGLYVC